MDLGAIRHNVAYLLGRLPAGTRLLAVVKAGGYGHGAVEVARAALEAGAWGLAVATPREAAPLLGLVEPERILVMAALTESAARAAAPLGCAFAVSGEETLAGLEAGAGAPLPVHLKIDTGMGRLGCLPEAAPGLARRIADSARLRLAGTWTHFASSESDEDLTRAQFKRFLAAVEMLGVDPGLRHAANSGAALRHPEMALDGVRCGIAVYGCEWPDLRGAMAVRALLTHVKTLPAGATVGYGATWRAERPTRVGTVTIGYADGVMRSRGGTGWVLVRGRRVPLIGRVSMDVITVDLEAAPDAAPGDAVTLLGADGSERITAEQVAAWSGTISYEVLTSVGPRVERRYQE